MNIINYLFLVALTLIMLGCCKEDPIDPAPLNFGTATLNGSKINMTPHITKSVSVSDKYFIIIESELINAIGGIIQFNWIDRHLQSQQLLDTSRESKILSSIYRARLGDGDVAGNRYNLNDKDTISDFLQITSINSETGVWKGIFQGSFIIDEGKKVNSLTPDTIILKDGYFEVTLD